MKNLLLFTIVLLTAFGMSAAPVDAVAAKGVARQFMQNISTRNSLLKAPSHGNIDLVYTASHNNLPLYYIFNTSNSFIIVSGDDRAQEVLAYGETPMDMANMPANMREWLDGYGEQIAYVIAHPEKFPEGLRNLQATQFGPKSVAPLLTETWGQGDPYNKFCPEYNGIHSLTGCCATSLSMVIHHWQYPVNLMRTLPSYTTSEHSIYVPELEPVTLDWDNMLDHYGSGQFNDAQGDAVAWLMRYVGQAEKMDYSPYGSGTYPEDILKAVKTIGYDGDATLEKKGYYGTKVSDENWGLLMLDELEQGRPIVFTGGALSGHAFNIDGYDTESNKFHINWGWEGRSNGYFAINAFRSDGGGYVYDQCMVIGIMPPPTTPTLKVRNHRVNINTFVDQQGTGTFIVKGAMLTDDVALRINDPTGYFSISTDHFAKSQMSNKRTVTVTYKPTESGTHTATVTITSPGAPDHTIYITGTANIDNSIPVLNSVTSSISSDVNAQWSDATDSKYVSSYCLEVARLPFHDWRFGDKFAATTTANTSTSEVSSLLDQFTDNPGWTGSKVYLGNGYLRLGNTTTKGWLETPALDMHGNNGLVTVKVLAAIPTADNSALLTISCAGNDTTVTLTTDTLEYCVMLPCPEGNDAHVRLANSPTGKRALIHRVDIIAGDGFSPVDHSKSAYIDGITDMNYTINGLKSGIYLLRVQANYIDGSKSDWSNSMLINVKPKVNADVNGDGEVNISDVNAVIDDILSGSVGEIYDVNGDGEVNIADVNIIIDMILG